MGTQTPYVSLIPYLQPSPVNLAISLCSDEQSELERISNPFVLVDDSSPVGTLIHGSFVTDSGSTIRELFLFIQRSEYRLSRDPLAPLTNRHVTSFWQKALELGLSRPDSGLIRLSGLTNSEGAINAFAPLFFCKLKRSFFEPPCPVCGGQLMQCEDDDLLNSAGLSTFSASLKRYLYCPRCHEKGQALFYAYKRDMENPEVVKDRMELIKGLSSLKDIKNSTEPLPCLSCDQAKACFGPEARAGTRIAIFSFYPFHMLPFEAMSLQCEDFLALVSGASSQELLPLLGPSWIRASNLSAIQQSGDRPLAFFSDSEKHFLEVLHIKLTLLRQLADWIQTLPLEDLSPLSPISLDSFWVDLPDASDSVPYFWVFRLRPSGVVLGSDHKGLDLRRVGVSKIHFMALAWFYVLLRNSTQEMDKVVEQLNGMIVDGSPVSIQDFMAQMEASSAFGPSNIFWKPQEMEIPQDSIELWNSCMELGWKLIRACFDDATVSADLDHWFGEIDRLRDDVKGALFSHRPSTAAPARSPQEDIAVDRQIGAILADIAAKWEADLLESIGKPSQELSAPPETAQEMPVHTEPLASDQVSGAMEETIIVAPGPQQPSAMEQEPSTGPEKHMPEEEEIPETIIFSSPTQEPTTPPPGPAPTSPEPPPEKPQDKEFEKTLSMLDQELLGLAEETLEPEPEAKPVQPDHEEAQKEEEEEIPETIIIKPEDK